MSTNAEYYLSKDSTQRMIDEAKARFAPIIHEHTILNDAIADKQDKITGTEGQFVVIGSDGNVTTVTITQAEGVSF